MTLLIGCVVACSGGDGASNAATSLDGASPTSVPLTRIPRPATACDELSAEAGGKGYGPAGLPASVPDVAPFDTAAWTTLRVRARGGDYGNLQSAYDAALRLGAHVRILVEAGLDAGDLVLRNRKGKTNWIYIEPEVAESAAFPPPGTRATRVDAPLMYRIRGELSWRGSYTEAIWAEKGAGYTRIIGADVSIPDDERRRTRSHLIRIRGDRNGEPEVLSETPQWVILDRSYVHIPTDGTRFAGFLIGLNGRNLAVVDSYVVGGGHGWEATKAINSSYAPGPMLIENNYLATDGINVFFGADVGAHQGWIPSDITIRRNHVHKPLEWRGQPELRIKNGFEIKNAQRVLVECNVFENNWVNAQTGKMILMRSESPDGVCEDITFRFNKIVRTPTVWDVVATDGDEALRPARRISIHDNLAVEIGENTGFGDRGAIAKFSSKKERPLEDVLFAHNTHDDLGGVGSAVMLGDASGARNIVIRDNIFDHAEYGVKRDSTVEGTASLDAAFGPGNYVWNHNVGAGFPARLYPGAENEYPPLDALRAEFEDAEADDLRFVASSRYRRGGASPPSDGPARGADLERLERFLAGVVTGVTGTESP